jgi:hypothetical protein
MTSATERLRASDRRGGFPLGADPLALHRPSGTVECGRGDSFGRSRSPRDRRFSLRGGPTIDRKEPDRAETPCLPPTFGSGDAKAVRAARRNVQQCWAARLRGSVGNESIQSPREHRADARRQRRTNATDSSVEERPEVESSAAQRGNTEASAARTARGHAQPVNATTSERTRRGDGMVEAAEEGNASKGHRHRGGLPRTFGSTTFGSAARLRGRARESETWRTPWSAAGCNKPADRRTSGSSDLLAAEETAGAGRNGKSGTCAGRGSPEPKSRRRLGREWTQRRSCRRRGEGSTPREESGTSRSIFGSTPTDWTARTGMPLNRGLAGVSIR